MWSVHARIQQSLSVQILSLSLQQPGPEERFGPGIPRMVGSCNPLRNWTSAEAARSLEWECFAYALLVLVGSSSAWISTLGVYGSWLKRNCLEGSPTTRHAVGILCGRDFKCSLEVEPIGPGDGWAWRGRVASERNHFIHIPNGCLRLRFVFNFQLFIMICLRTDTGITYRTLQLVLL